MRDYVHILDLAEGHINSLKYLDNSKESHTLNLGTGIGLTVIDIITEFEKQIGQTLPIEYFDKRIGDISISYAKCDKASSLINWKSKKSLSDMVSSTLLWKKNYPNGYNN